MPDLSPDQAIDALRGLPEDRQRAILAKLSPEVKQGIMTKLSGASRTQDSTPPATQPEERTFGNYADEIASGIGRGVMDDVAGIAQTVAHPIKTVKDLKNQTMAAVREAGKEFSDTAAAPMGQRLGAAALTGLENAPMIGGIVQHAEEGGEEMGSPEAAGAAAEGITAFAAPEVFGSGIKAVAKGVPGVARGVAGTGSKTVRDLVKETKTDNLKTAAENQKLGEQHLTQTQDALHESEGRELQYKQSVKSAVDAARDKQTELDQEHSKAVQDALHENSGRELAYQQELSKAKLESEDAYQKKLAEVESKRAKAKQDYRKDLLDYSKKKAKLQAEYQDAVDKAASQTRQQAKIKPTEGRLKQAYSALRAGVETARENALKIGNKKYNKVNEKLNPLPADEDVISGAVAEAKGKIKGTGPEPDILKKMGSRLDKDDYVYQGGQKFGPGTPLYESVKASKEGIPGGEAKPLTYEDLQGVYSELGTELSRGTLPGDTYAALDTLHEAIGSEMERLANSKGMGAQLLQARNYWRRMKQTFGKPYGATDAATKTVRDAAGNLVSAEEQANRIRLLGSFDPRLPGLFEHVDNLSKGAESLPKLKPGRATLASVVEARKAAPPLPPKPATIPDPSAVAPREVPQPLRAEIPDRPGTVAAKMPAQPERVAPPNRPQYAPPKTIGPEEVRAAKQKGIEGRQRLVEHKAAWMAIGPAFYLLHDVLRGEMPSVGGTATAIAAPMAIQAAVTKILSHPKVVDFLTKATPADVAQIPPEIRGSFSQVAAQAKKRGIRVSRAFTAAAAAGIPTVQTGTGQGVSPSP